MTPYELGAAYAEKEAAEKTAVLPLLAAGGAMLMHGLGGALLGNAAIGGGIGALTAKPGERMKGFAQGAGWGALTGGVLHGIGAGAHLLRGVATNGAGKFAPLTNKMMLGKAPMPEGMPNTYTPFKGISDWMRKPGLGPKAARGLSSPFGVNIAGMALPFGGGGNPDPVPMSNLPPNYSA